MTACEAEVRLLAVEPMMMAWLATPSDPAASEPMTMMWSLSPGAFNEKLPMTVLCSELRGTCPSMECAPTIVSPPPVAIPAPAWTPMSVSSEAAVMPRAAFWPMKTLSIEGKAPPEIMLSPACEPMQVVKPFSGPAFGTWLPSKAGQARKPRMVISRPVVRAVPALTPMMVSSVPVGLPLLAPKVRLPRVTFVEVVPTLVWADATPAKAERRNREYRRAGCRDMIGSSGANKLLGNHSSGSFLSCEFPLSSENNPASSTTLTPSAWARSSFDPASSPATT